MLITNNWDDEIVRKFRNLGFLVYKALRKNGKPEFVAMNFDKNTGVIFPRVKDLDVESIVSRHGKQRLTDQSKSDCEKLDSLAVKKSFNKVHFSSATVEWPTPQGVFNELNDEFGFTLDPCATHENAKCEKYFTMDDDGLKQDWGKETVFMNPPYGREIGHWMKKAYESSLEGATVVSLPPARTDNRWWHDYAMKGEIRFIRGRLKFGGAKNSAPFPSAIVIFRPPEDADVELTV